MTTIAKIEAYKLITIDSDFIPRVEEYIDAVTAYIERYTGRTFTSETGERLYDGSNSRELFIDDALDITEVKVNDTVLDEDDYVLYPSNRLPKTRIILPYKLFYSGYQNVTVTGTWGYEAPEALVLAATMLVSDIIDVSNSGDGSSGEIASETIGRYSVSYVTGSSSSMSPKALEAHKILKMYRRMI